MVFHGPAREAIILGTRTLPQSAVIRILVFHSPSASMIPHCFSIDQRPLRTLLKCAGTSSRALLYTLQRHGIIIFAVRRRRQAGRHWPTALEEPGQTDAPLPARLSAKVRDSTIASIFHVLISFLSSILQTVESPPRLSMCTDPQNDTSCSKVGLLLF